MFTSHLSYRAGSLPSAWTESPGPLPPRHFLASPPWRLEPLSNRPAATVTNGRLKPQRDEDKQARLLGTARRRCAVDR